MNQEEYQKALGENIVKRRLELELSQEDVVKLSKITTTHISRIENGDTNVTVSTLNKLAAALKTKPAKLLP